MGEVSLLLQSYCLEEHFPKFSAQKQIQLWSKGPRLWPKTWQYCPCDNGFEGMKDSKLRWSWTLQRTDEARPCISWLGS